jgi:hypothetical protein
LVLSDTSDADKILGQEGVCYLSARDNDWWWKRIQTLEQFDDLGTLISLMKDTNSVVLEFIRWLEASGFQRNRFWHLSENHEWSLIEELKGWV